MFGPTRKLKYSADRMIQEFVRPKGGQMTAAAAAVAPDQPRTIVVTLHDDATSSKSVQKALDNIVGLKKLSATASSGKPTQGLDSTEGIFLPTLGAVIMQADMDQVSRLAKEAESGTSDIVIVTPERRFTTADVSYGDDYLHGYRDGVDGLVEKLLKKGGSGERRPEMASALGDAAGSQAFTYGLNMVGAVDSPCSGDGARVAILDTGIDFGHPAFAGRIKESAYFVGTSAQDGHPVSHGTHCAGTACGPKVSSAPEATRFGVAYDAELYVCKVLPDFGSGGSSIYQGMQWAIDRKCHVISMSIQSDSPQVYPDYDIYGQRALNAGCLIVAAAGNNANRPASFGFVAAPANALTIIAVGGLDRNYNMYSASGRSNGVDGGNIDVAGPGVDVYSTIRGGGYGRLTGTSMATPHVAGVAALWHEKTGATGVDLAFTLYQSVMTSQSFDTRDVGKGVVQAPPKKP